MANSDLHELEELFWPRGWRQDVWMVIDGSRDPGIYPTLINSYLDYSCLYRGDLAPALQRAAPYLVQLQQDGPYSRELLSRAWGVGWGIVLRCDLTMQRVLRHLRKFLLVRDPRGKQLLFRYYAPHVLRTYLPTCNAAEIAEFYGPIESFYVEDENPSIVWEFRRDGPAQVQNRHDLRTHAAPSGDLRKPAGDF